MSVSLLTTTGTAPTCPISPAIGGIIRGSFGGGPNLGGGGVLLLRNEGKSWYKAPCCCLAQLIRHRVGYIHES